MTTLSVASRGSTDEKLQWAFKLYDKDSNGFLVQEEVVEILTVGRVLGGCVGCVWGGGVYGWMCMGVWVYGWMCVGVWVDVCRCMGGCVWMYGWMCVGIWVDVCGCVWMCVDVCRCMCGCVWMCVDVCGCMCGCV